MDQLSNLPNLSLAELRKILTDNDVKETSPSKESLMNQVSEVLLTNMMIQDMMETETTQTKQRVKPPPVKDERTLLREQQDREYQASIAIDYKTDKNGDYLIEQPEQIDKDAVHYVGFEELSPRSLRAKRMEFYM
jgi:aconitase B